MRLSEAEIRERLGRIVDPCSVAHGRPTDIVRFRLVDEIEAGERPRVVLRLTEPTCLYRVWFLRQVRAVLGEDAVVEFAPGDAIWDPEER